MHSYSHAQLQSCTVTVTVMHSYSYSHAQLQSLTVTVRDPQQQCQLPVPELERNFYCCPQPMRYLTLHSVHV